MSISKKPHTPAHLARQESRRKISDKIKNDALDIVKAVIKNETLTTQNYLKYYQQVDEDFQKKFDYAKAYKLARLVFLKYIRALNRQLEQKLPEPALLGVFFRKPPIISESFFQKGGLVASTIPKVTTYWQYEVDFDVMDTLAWCLYSAVVFGGLNHQSHLDAFWSQVQRKEIPFRIIDNHLLFCLQIPNKKYGYHVQSENKQQVMRSVDYVLDDVTALWLIRLKNAVKENIVINGNSATLSQLNFSLVRRHLLDKLEQVTGSKINFNTLLGHGSFYLLFQIDSELDPLLLLAQQHRASHCTTAVSKTTLIDYFEPNFRQRMLDINPADIFQLNITPSVKNTAQTLQSLPKLRHDVMQYIKHYVKNKDVKGLETLLAHFPQPNHQRLLTWTIEQARKNGSSSVKRYLLEFADEWLSLTFDEDFEDIDAEEYLSVYQQIITQKPEGREFYAANRLKDFHKHLVSNYDAPVLNFQHYDMIKVVKAELVSSKIYAAMLQALRNDSVFNNPFDKLQCQCLIILAYRSGMRVSELVGLKTSDFTNTRHLGVFVKSNKERKLKTDSAKRYLPLWVLLNSQERDVLSSYIDIQRKNLAKYAFSRGSGDFPISTFVAQQLLKQLADALLVEYRFSFHGLRHTLLSNLAVVLFCDYSKISWFTDYSVKQVERIKFELLGKSTAKNRYTLQNRWMALSDLAGHLSVEMTMKHYLHTVYLIAGFSRAWIDTKLPAQTLVNITNLSKRRLSKRLPNVRFSDSQQISLRLLRPLYSYELSTSRHRLGITSKNDSVSDILLETVRLDDAEKLPLYKKYPRQTIVSFLTGVESGMSLAAAATDYNLSIEDGRRFYQHAVSLAGITNTHGKPRLFTKDRQGKLLPTKPKGKHANRLVNVFFDKAYALHKENPEKLNQFMQTFLSRVTSTKTTIRFTSKEKEELNQFLKTGIKLLGSSHWCLYAQTTEDAVKLKRKLNLPLNLHIKKHDDYAGYTVDIVKPIEKDILSQQGRSYRSLGVLKYVCHLWLLLDVDTYSLIVKQH